MGTDAYSTADFLTPPDWFAHGLGNSGGVGKGLDFLFVIHYVLRLDQYLAGKRESRPNNPSESISWLTRWGMHTVGPWR